MQRVSILDNSRETALMAAGNAGDGVIIQRAPAGRAIACGEPEDAMIIT
jgi:hypothetical protein